MSVTIDSLDIQIRSSAGSAKQNIEGLASALERLNGQAKVTKIVNALDKLNVSLTNLRSNSGVMGQLSSLSKSMSQLATIPKLTGLQSAIKQIEKLPEVMRNLNSADMAKFTLKLNQLSKALAPLATQLGVVGTAFSKLPPKISKVVTATNRMQQAVHANSNALNHQSLNLMTAIQNLQTYLSAIHFVADAVSRLMSGAIEWDGIQFRFGRAFGEDAEEVYAYAQKVSDVLKINIQQFMQYSSLYGSLLSGFGMAQEKVTTISVGLTELSYDIWAAYNDRFKTLEDASEAVRSAITGEIEPIRNAGIALTEASLQEYLESVGMATVSIEKLTEAQKAEVRYAAMVDAAMNQGIVGTYAREMQTAEGAVRTLTQQLKTLGQALGSLFLPILQAVIPWISAFVELVYEAVVALASLLGIQFQEITWDKSASSLGGMADSAGDASDALGDAAKEAKKLKSYTMGFDELNIINPPSENSSGGGAAGGGGFGAGLNLDTLWDDSIFAAASKQVDELKQKIKDFYEKWKWQIDLIAAALAVLGISKLLAHLGEALGLGEKFLSAMNTIGKLAVSAIVITLQYTLMTEFFKDYIESGDFWDYVKAMLIGAAATWVLYSMWGPTGLVIGLGVTAVASLSAIIENGGITNVESAVVAFTGLASAVAAVVIAWKKLGPAIKGSNLVQVLVGIKNGSAAANSALTFMFPTFFKITGFFDTAAKAVASFVSGLTAGPILAVAGIVAAIASVAVFLSNNWGEVTAAVKGFFETNIVPKLENIKDSWDKMKSSISGLLPESVIQWFKDAGTWIGNIVTKVGEWFKSVEWMKIIGTAFETVGAILFSVFSSALAGAISAVIGVLGGLIQYFSGVVQVITGLVKFVTALVTGGDLVEPWKQIKQGVVDIFVGMYSATIGVVEEFVNGVIDWFVSLWDELVGHSIVPDMIESIIEWFLSLPSRIFGPIDAFVRGIIEKFKGMWGDIKLWWNNDVAPKFTLSYWRDKFDVIRDAIQSKLSETKEAAIAKWGEIKEWFSSNIAPKFTLAFWLGEFENLKEGFTQTIKNAVNAGIDIMNKFIGLVNSNLKFSWDSFEIAGQEIVPAGSIQLFTIPTIPRFENGGFIEDGLFTMNHGEIAGKFSNGKSVVANNQQIVEGIAAGVYEAVVAAMNASSGRQDQNINVYLDGKQIYASVKKRDSERGKQLVGNQLGYSY